MTFVTFDGFCQAKNPTHPFLTGNIMFKFFLTTLGIAN